VEVWFNPSCSKCRIARDELDAAGVEYTLRRYLDDPPSEAELRDALTALGLQPWDITRTPEPLARELGLKDKPRDADAWIRMLVEHPQLIQRPLVLTDDGRAWVARDGETRSEVVAATRPPAADS
jgi:arsenate reductase